MAKRLLMKAPGLALLIWGCLISVAAATELFTIADPPGDDNGAGQIVYPGRMGMEPGDLDLLAFSATAAEDGLWIDARFANPIKKPEGRMAYDNMPLTSYVHEEFYNIAIDIYIDQDGLRGSGNLEMLPGRMAEVHPDFAWEKAVIVSPRPQRAQSLLTQYLRKSAATAIYADQGRIGMAENEKITATIKDRMKQDFYFPERIKVHDRVLHFFVPYHFLGGKEARNWRYVVTVMGADVNPPADLSSTFDEEKPLKQRPPLMILPVTIGRPTAHFGLETGADPHQPPIIDMLLPSVAMQQKVLSDYDTVAKRLVSLPGVAASGVVPTAVKKPAALPTSKVVPSPGPPLPSTDQAKPQNDAVLEPQAMMPEAPQTKQSVTDQLLRPADAAPAAPHRGVAERLRELQRLREQKLITLEEYDQIRQRILAEL